MVSSAQFRRIGPTKSALLPLIGQSRLPHSLHRSPSDTHSEHECQANQLTGAMNWKCNSTMPRLHATNYCNAIPSFTAIMIWSYLFESCKLAQGCWKIWGRGKSYAGVGLLRKSYGGSLPHSRLFLLFPVTAHLRAQASSTPPLSRQSLSTLFATAKVKILSLALYTTGPKS
jgi:hypothetical protein